MAYHVRVLPPVRKDLRKMDPMARKGVLGVLANLRAEPRPGGVCSLRGARDFLRLRIGDYRVIYTVDDGALLVTVLVAGHRRDVYDEAKRRLKPGKKRPRR